MNLFTKVKDNKICMRAFAKWIAVFLSLALIFNFGVSKPAHANTTNQTDASSIKDASSKKEDSKKEGSFVLVETLKDDLKICGVDACLIGYYGLVHKGETFFSFYRIVPKNEGDLFNIDNSSYDSTPLKLPLMDEQTKHNLMEGIDEQMLWKKQRIDDAYVNFDKKKAEDVLSDAITDSSDKNFVAAALIISVSFMGLWVEFSLIKSGISAALRYIQYKAGLQAFANNFMGPTIDHMASLSSWNLIEEGIVEGSGSFLKNPVTVFDLEGSASASSIEEGIYLGEEASYMTPVFGEGAAEGAAGAAEGVAGATEGVAVDGAAAASTGMGYFVASVVVAVVAAVVILYMIYSLLHSHLQIAHIHNLGLSDKKGIVNLDGIEGFDDGIDVAWSYRGDLVESFEVSHVFTDKYTDKLNKNCDCITISTPWSDTNSLSGRFKYAFDSAAKRGQKRDDEIDPDWKPGKSNLHYTHTQEKNIVTSISDYLDSFQDLSYKYCYYTSGRDVNDYDNFIKALYNGYDKLSADYIASKDILDNSLSDEAKVRLAEIKLHEDYDFDKSMRAIYSKYDNDSDKTQRNQKLRANIEAYQEWYKVMSEEFRNELGPIFVGSMNMWYRNMQDWEFDNYECFLGSYH